MKLSKEELQQLIDTYRTELRLLTYRSQQVTDTLKGLERNERAAKPKGKRGRPAKKAAAKKAAGKRGRPAKKAAKKAAAKKAAGKRGRPAKKAAKKAGRPAKKAAGKRGRPAKKAAVKKAAGKRGRPAKKAAVKKAAGKRGRPAKKATAQKSAGAKGYRLNVWDEIVMNSVGDGNKVGVFADFFKAAKKNKASSGLSDKDLYARINQSLHKLANKRNVLKKVEHEGRGFGYQRT